jgi:hypothetical protein
MTLGVGIGDGCSAARTKNRRELLQKYAHHRYIVELKWGERFIPLMQFTVRRHGGEGW